MRRRLRHLALFLVLGAVINYNLSMGFIWFGSVVTAERHRDAFHETSYTRQDDFGMTFLRWKPVRYGLSSPSKRPLPGWSRLHHAPRPYQEFSDWLHSPTMVERWEFAAGWPMRSLIYEFDDPPVGSLVAQRVIRSGIELPPRPVRTSGRTYAQPRAIPTRIAPAGFALNTLLFAALAAIMWYTPPAIRRIRRKRGNRCLRCGYSREGLADDAACPECGGK